jgi:RHH-type proline utilization regulon transcriptional repressor/proline dehydrogenase/delta 1-pyrroline-5-carboxylate dehydrogenase
MSNTLLIETGLEEAPARKNVVESNVPERVTLLAAELAEAAHRAQTRGEKAESAQMARMMNDDAGKAFTLAMADRVFRSHVPSQQAGRVNGLLARYGLPRYLPMAQRLMLAAGAAAAKVLPGPVMSAMQCELRRSSARVILAGEPGPLNAYLKKRHAAGTRVNLNHLGEAILGEEEARHRLDAVIGHLRNPLVDYVSVKISAVFSQINVLDFDHTLSVIKERLRVLYRQAMSAGKFVNLDMEEYRDLGLTLAAFCEVLREPEFMALSAGIVLQAYLPDAWTAQQKLTDWARCRVTDGGAAIKVRIVKGANLAMENVEAELHGWNVATYSSKVETDANYRRMVEFGCRPENAAVVRLGVASHNLFDIALALTLREDNGVADRVELEMLEGMANHQARVVQQKAGGLLVYAPAVGREDFISALSYLVRRLDENTSPENFLHDLFDLHPGSEAWERQRSRFVTGWADRTIVSSDSNRGKAKIWPPDVFHNAADTDWTQADRRQSLNDALAEWSAPILAMGEQLPSVDRVLTTAAAAQPAWEARGSGGRAAILRAAAEVMESRRFATIAQMAHEAKKAAAEGDVEVSEAVDFANYAAEILQAQPLGDAIGIVVITPPWNFPYAIPCGNVIHALAAGNSVILKPAPETVGVAWHLANHLWDAGVPRDVLQFYPCPDNEIGQSLICDARVAAVVLTGAYETARMFQGWRPSLKLLAETSGKNAIIVTAQADRDLAIKDIVRSAFGHAGQKCSAASLAILEAEVYDDPAFRRSLRDAACSLRVGPSTDLGSIVTPLIREPAPYLKRALTTLDRGETWLLEPKVDTNDPCLWSPGIKLGVKPGSWFHQTECFGPVLGVMRADDLAQAIRFQNDTPFGLTGGIHSLDEAEVETWKRSVQVGNAYVNRPITGAVVRRQPFGGWKRSSIGPGSKMGGPNYLSLFAKPSGKLLASDNFEQVWNDIFSKADDPSQLRCESNELRYRPARGVILRLEQDDAGIRALAEKAARLCGTPLHISVAADEPETQFIARLPKLAESAEFLRTTKAPGDAVLNAAYDAGLNGIDAALSNDGRHELPRWLREQAVSTTRHRYGLISESGDRSV